MTDKSWLIATPTVFAIRFSSPFGESPFTHSPPAISLLPFKAIVPVSVAIARGRGRGGF